MTLKQIRSHVKNNLDRLYNKIGTNLNPIVLTGSEIDDIINTIMDEFLEDTGLLVNASDVTITDGYGDLPSDCHEVDRVEWSDGVPLDRYRHRSLQVELKSRD